MRRIELPSNQLALNLSPPAAKSKRQKIPAIQRLAKLSAVSRINRCPCGTPCIEYIGKAIDHHKGGYARIQDDDGRVTQAHTLAWTHKNGPVPKGMILMHQCNNPRCCNPGHIVAGTHKQNMEYMAMSGRQPKQTGKDKAISIAEFFLGNPGIDLREIVKKFEVSVVVAINITTGRTYSQHTGIEFIPAKPHQRNRATLH